MPSVETSVESRSADRFVPVAADELEARLLAIEEWTATERSELAAVFGAMRQRLRVDFRSRLDQLKSLYLPFDPDRVTIPLSATDIGARELNDLFDRFDELAERANFHALTLAELNEALGQRTAWGLNLEVDMEAFERLDIYARGWGHARKPRRRWQNLFRLEDVEVPTYQRLVVMFRFRREHRIRRYSKASGVFIKLFKDIPQMDLDMLLPATSVKMSMVDRAQIFLPTLTGLAMAIWQIFKGILFLAFAGVYGIFTVVAFITGTIGYGMRSFYGYLNTKNKYQLSLTESLYYQNLDNNSGVFYRLLDEGEEQELSEAMLAYAFGYLAERGRGEATTPYDLDRTVEAFLLSLGVGTINFEIDDALVKLTRWNVAAVEAGEMRVLPPTEAVSRLQAEGDSVD